MRILVCLLLLAVPLGISFYVYHLDRLEEATVRNFRALGAAAVRVQELRGNLPRVASNQHLGFARVELPETTTGLFSGRSPSTPESPSHIALLATTADNTQALVRGAQQISLVTVGGRGARAGPTISSATEIFDHGPLTMLDSEGAKLLWKAAAAFQKEQEPHHGRLGRLDVVSPVLRKLELDRIRQFCGHDEACREKLEVVNETACTGEAQRWVGTEQGVALEMIDCRPFKTRARELYQALTRIVDERPARFRGDLDKVAQAQDLFGVRHRISLERSLESVTRHLHAFFDSYMVVDGNGQVVYAGLSDLDATLAPRPQVKHRQKPPFAGLVDLSELLKETEETEGLGLPRSETDGALGLSVVRRIAIGDVDVRVFVHPFTLHDTAPLDGRATRESSYYMVGIVRAGELRQEALRMRTGYMTVATLVVCAIVLLLPVIWLRSVGDRLVLGAYKLLAVVIACMLALIVLTTAAASLWNLLRDRAILDGWLWDAATELRQQFAGELEDKLQHLIRTGESLDATEERRRTDHFSSFVGADAKPADLAEAIGDHFYCGINIRASRHPILELPKLNVAFRLNEGGSQVDCRDWRSTRTKRMNLKFREYFTQPSTASMWWRHLDQGRLKCEYMPFFAERIYSVVRNTKTTVLAVPAMNECWARKPNGIERGQVFAAVTRFPSLEDAVLPPGMHYSVVDGETGRTLFDSDPDRALVTNYVDDVDRDEALLEAFRMHGTEEGEAISIRYNGIPIRAHVMVLDDATPWMLVVYRDHRLEDQTGLLAAVSTVLIWYAFVGLLAIAGVVSRLILGRTFVRFAVRRIIVGSNDGNGYASSSWAIRWVIATIFVLVSVVAVPFVLQGATTHYATEVAEGLRKSMDEQEHRRVEGQRILAGDYLIDPRTQRSRWKDRHYVGAEAFRLFGHGGESGRKGGNSEPATVAGTTVGDRDVAEADVPSHRVSSFSAAVREAFRAPDVPSCCTLSYSVWLATVSVLSIILVVGLIGWIAATIVRVVATGRDAVMLPCWRVGEDRGDETRLVLVCTSKAEGCAARETLVGQGGYRKACRTRDGWGWGPVLLGDGPHGGRLLFVVEDLDVIRDLRSEDLLDMLETAERDSAPILLCTRAVPSYQLAEYALEQPGRARSERARWEELLSKFETFRAWGSEDGARANDAVECLDCALKGEVAVNPDLAHGAIAAMESGVRAKGGDQAKPGLKGSDSWFGRMRKRRREFEGWFAATVRFRQLGESYFARQWAMSTLDERLQLYTLSRHGFANATQREALASLANRGLIRGFAEGGLVELRSAAFGDYIRSLTHDELLLWRDEGHHNNWRTIWPVVGALAVLAFAFIQQASPQTVAALLAAVAAVAGVSPFGSLAARGGGLGSDTGET